MRTGRIRKRGNERCATDATRTVDLASQFDPVAQFQNGERSVTSTDAWSRIRRALVATRASLQDASWADDLEAAGHQTMSHGACPLLDAALSTAECPLSTNCRATGAFRSGFGSAMVRRSRCCLGASRNARTVCRRSRSGRTWPPPPGKERQQTTRRIC